MTNIKKNEKITTHAGTSAIVVLGCLLPSKHNVKMLMKSGLLLKGVALKIVEASSTHGVIHAD